MFEGIVSQPKFHNGTAAARRTTAICKSQVGPQLSLGTSWQEFKKKSGPGKTSTLTSLTMWVLVQAALCPLHIEDQKPTEHQEELPPPPPPEVEPVVPKAPLLKDTFPVPLRLVWESSSTRPSVVGSCVRQAMLEGELLACPVMQDQQGNEPLL